MVEAIDYETVSSSKKNEPKHQRFAEPACGARRRLAKSVAGSGWRVLRKAVKRDELDRRTGKRDRGHTPWSLFLCGQTAPARRRTEAARRVSRRWGEGATLD